MRVAVLILVLANLVVFAWLRWARPGAPEREFGLVPPATGGIALKVVASSPAAGGAAPTTPVRPQHCLTAGPMTAVAPAAALAARLGESGLAARTLVRAETVPGGYQVLLAGFADKASAVKAVARLRKSGIEDLSVGDDKAEGSVVSLGVYRSLNDARARVVAIKKLGFEPQIRIRARTAPRWYLELPASASAAAVVRAAGVAVHTGRCTAADPGSGSAGTAATPAASPGTVPVPGTARETAPAGGS